MSATDRPQQGAAAPAAHQHGPDCNHDHDHGHDHAHDDYDPNLLLNRQPVIRTEPKIGRNDPCPCGSGKKHKKCHGA